MDQPQERGAQPMRTAIRGGDLEAVTGCGRLHSYPAGKVIFRHQDDTNNRTFIIVQGMVRVIHPSREGHEVILYDLSSGDMFGELAAIDGHTRPTTVIAKKDSVVASLPTRSFLSLAYSNQEYLAVLKRSASRVRRLIDQVYDLGMLKVPGRIRAELLRLAETHSAAPNRGVISPLPTHAEIAIRLNTQRETVTRELNALARQKVIARTGRDLHILDMTRLGQMVNGND
jgi:CRP/FNR family transcriptional regulator, cyclic AMP receptor protein